MMDKTTRTMHIRRCFAMVIAMVMALTMFTGVTSISHASVAFSAKATNYGFRMVRVSWSAVKIEIPQEPAPPAESVAPAADSVDPVADSTVDPAADKTADPASGEIADPAEPSSGDGNEPAEPEAVPNAESVADPDVEPTVDPNAESATDPNAELTASPNAESVDDPNAEPAADPNAEPAADPNAEPAADPNAEPVAGPNAEPVDVPNAEPAVDPNADPNAEPAAEPNAEPSTDPNAEPNVDPATDPNAEPVDGSNAESVADPNAEPATDPAATPTDNSVMSLFAEPVYDTITYKVYRSTAKYGQYKLISTTQDTFCIDKGLKIKKRYYYKVIAYRSNGEQYGTSAIVSVKVAKQVTANMTLLMKGNAAFNFRVEAKQKLYRYDTLQGGCAYGGYAYLTLYNRKVEKCKIVKVRLSDLRVVKVSGVLPIFHGNNLSYNTKKKRIVASCCTTNKKAKNRAVLINPNTLRVTATKNIKLTKKVKKIPRSVWKKNKGITAIAYNEKHNCYVARLRQDGNIVILNKNLVPLRYVKLKGKKTGLLVQGIETVGNYIYDVRSFKGRRHYCMVTVHTMAGKYVGQMKFPYGTAPGKELQCIFHDGRQFYAGFYYSTSQMDDTKKNHVNRINLIQRLNNL